jgi:hypothetical protein
MEKELSPKITNRKLNLIFLLILSISVVLISFSLKNITFVNRADEGLYLNYSIMVSDHGIDGFRRLFKDYFSDPTHRITQNPLRVGFIIIASLWIKLFGYSMYSLAILSLFSYCIFLLLSFCFAKKYLGKNIVLLFLILLVFSPINMAMARRALIDSTSNLFILSSILLFFENLKGNKAFRNVLFILVYSFTILIKESSALLALFFMLYILITRKKNADYLSMKGFLIAAVAPFSIAGIIYIILAGGTEQFFKAMISVLTSPGINTYAILYCAGPWFRYLVDFMLLSPWVFLLGVGFVFFYLTKKDKKDELTYLLLFSITSIFFHSFLIKNIRYLMILDFPFRLFVISMLYELFQPRFKQKAVYLIGVVVIAISLSDYFSFNKFFVQAAIYDPVSFWLLQVHHIIPWR